MAARQFATSVGASATVIEGTQYATYILRNMDDTDTVYLGDSSVTSSTGWPLEPGDIYSPSELAHKSLTGKDAQRIYGRTASDTAEVRVFVQGALL